ncbi:MAG: hypothetical protein JWR47_727 [Phenylobacterium sp.]|uniref:hypothetical protein n=1 Tax=Phenylobacterium sp. TaxID=1871053 RepID=UPI00263685FF|nr:hypothetical protein [Phenylobacterium sp.]MDB5434470.1 hypothetical protein [Phenylobacterium sp.]MDB5464988.1 hypothetical protein [Phenylobacterium sp.]MDB5500058.1 hypothetical protein [Phenylobacterium sp.]
MSLPQDLTDDERKVLLQALREPLVDRDPMVIGVCMRLCGRRLLQRAGSAAAANGWRGSPHAFVLTREGWSLLKAERRRAPVLRVG